MNFVQFISKFNKEESGQDTVEYVLIGAAVILALVAGTPALSLVLTQAITALGTKIQTALQ